MENAPGAAQERANKRIRSSTWYTDSGVYRIQNVLPKEKSVANLDSVNVHITDNKLTANALIRTMIREIYAEQDSLRIAAFAGSMLAALFGDLTPTLISVLEDFIGHVSIVSDVNRAGVLFELEGPESAQQTVVNVAQIILIIFKNIHPSSYEPFMARRIKALKALVGIPDAERVNLAMPIEKAMIIRARLGHSLVFKRSILEILLVHRDVQSALGIMCNYLCNILEWHEMTNMLFVIQTIIVTRSPVLFDLRISADVLNFLEAAKAVQVSSYYGYFRIRETSQYKRGLVERAKFPTLAAVAQVLRSQIAGSAVNYQGMPGQVPVIVNVLVARHNQYLAGIQPDVHHSRLRYLLHYNDEEDA